MVGELFVSQPGAFDEVSVAGHPAQESGKVAKGIFRVSFMIGVRRIAFQQQLVALPATPKVLASPEPPTSSQHRERLLLACDVRVTKA